ncbi:MAG: hypothetical protein KQ78_01856 [Candidatus Izimaplasma bacterium HR2]|nr:MAG: hypothetical protein KQ78_01856 [Candidatus Izimaplasma bacterium HR2]
MSSLFNRDKQGRVKGLMSQYEEVKAFYSHVGIYKNHGYKKTNPLYISIFSYIEDGNKERASTTKGLSARQYYVYNQGLSLSDINIPKDKRRKIKSSAEFKNLLDAEVSKYLKQVTGKYKDMSDGQVYKIIEQRIEQNNKELGIMPTDAEADFNKKFLGAVFNNSKKMAKDKNRDLIKESFIELQDFINRTIKEGESSLSVGGEKKGKKDYYVLNLSKDMKEISSQYEALLEHIKKALIKGLKEGSMHPKFTSQLFSFYDSLQNRVLIYERKSGSKKVKKGYIRYFNEAGIKMDMKSLIVGEDKNKKLSMINEITSILSNAAGLGYEIAILAAAIELMGKGRDVNNNFKDISKEELKRRSLQIMVNESKRKKDIKIEGKVFSGEVTGDLIVDGKTSKADVVLRIENKLRKTKTEFKISAKNYNSGKFKVHTGKVTSFASAISQKGRQKEAYIAQSMFDTIAWYPAYFDKGKGNDSIYNMFKKMILLNLDFFYGFDVTQLFSAGARGYENMSEVLLRTAIKKIEINKESGSISLIVRVNKNVQ